MQPYFFPYIGYFQLVNAVDKFIFYDDVNFIKNGWINRNRILINGNASYLTVQLLDASPNKLINQVQFTDNRQKLKKSIELAYKKSPYFNNVWPVIEQSMNYNTHIISELAVETVKSICEYLNINTQFELSSATYSDTKGVDKAERLISICEINHAESYINPQGGIELYSKIDFALRNIDLRFLSTNNIIYNQGVNEFSPSLSIIDVLMHNSVTEIQVMLNDFELI